MQSELWMLTPLVLFISFKIPLISADDKTQRKLNNQNENYIITHYGVEYYTPFTDTEAPVHNSGYYTAEVIPVDVNTGEELKTVKNLFVPMHTGYSIGVNDVPRENALVSPKNDKFADKQPLRPVPQSENMETQDKVAAKDDIKSKIPKKFKSKYISPKKTVIPLNYSNVQSKSEDDINNAAPGFHESSSKQKVNRKRHTFETSDDILRLFYEHYKPLMQKQNLGYFYY